MTVDLNNLLTLLHKLNADLTKAQFSCEKMVIEGYCCAGTAFPLERQEELRQIAGLEQTKTGFACDMVPFAGLLKLLQGVQNSMDNAVVILSDLTIEGEWRIVNQRTAMELACKDDRHLTLRLRFPDLEASVDGRRALKVFAAKRCFGLGTFHMEDSDDDADVNLNSLWYRHTRPRALRDVWFGCTLCWPCPLVYEHIIELTGECAQIMPELLAEASREPLEV